MKPIAIIVGVGAAVLLGIVLATRAKVAQYTLTIVIEPLGTGNVVRVPDKDYYSLGEVVSLWAIPSSGYQFVEWEAKGETATGLRVGWTIEGNDTVIAHFT